MRRLALVAHPLLLSTFFILALYSVNVSEVTPSQTVIPLLAGLGFTCLLLLVAWLIFRDVIKAGIFVSVFVVLFFSFGHLSSATVDSHISNNILLPIWCYLIFCISFCVWLILRNAKETGIAGVIISISVVLFFSFGIVSSAVTAWGTSYMVLLPIWCILIFCCAYFLKKTRRKLYKPSVILSIIAVTLLLIPTISIVINETNAATQNTVRASNSESSTITLGEVETLPDIYYIILERYASSTTLKDVYNFDNDEFLSYLSNKGFYIASQSTSNYFRTPESLASSLNLEYIDYVSNYDQVVKKLEDYTVWRSLKSKGYTFVHMGNWWEPTRKNIYADINFDYWLLPEFWQLVYKTTMLYPLYSNLHIIEAQYLTHCKRIEYQFEELAKIPNIEEPTFVFAHMFTTHEPYLFDSNCNCWVQGNISKPDYLDTIICSNSKVMALIEELLASSEVPPIIIIQADEGPFPGGQAGWIETHRGWEEASEEELQQKARILNAYYLPNTDEAVLYPSITPVNSFRLIFNMYFDTDLELLPDLTYAFNGSCYNFMDVTSKVNYD